MTLVTFRRAWPMLAFAAVATLAQSNSTFDGPMWHHHYEFYDNTTGRNVTAFLWLPNDAPVVRGLILSFMILAEYRMVGDPFIRAVAQEQKLALLFTYPGFVSVFNGPGGDAAAFESLLAHMSAQSGHPELAVAPLIPFGHSTGAIFARNVAYYYPYKTAGVIYYKSGNMECPSWATCMDNTTLAVYSVPLLAVNGEFEEFGPSGPHPPGESWESQWLAQRESLRFMRSKGHLWQQIVDPGAGHRSWHTGIAEYVSAWIGSMASYRIPPLPSEWYGRYAAEKADGSSNPGRGSGQVPSPAVPDWYAAYASGTAPLPLFNLTPTNGWLTDSNIKPSMGQGPAPWASYGRNLSEAWWHFDGDLAMRWQTFQAGIDPPRLNQNVTYLARTGDQNQEDVLNASLINADGTIQPLVAASQTGGPSVALGEETHVAGLGLGPAGTPIARYWVSQGGAVQTGFNTFAVRLNEKSWGGNDYAVHVIAQTYGNATYRPAEWSGFLRLAPNSGKPTNNTITFASIPDHGDTDPPFKASATASSGLPVLFFVVSGPATVDPESGLVTLYPVPSGALNTLSVTLVAYQWGNSTTNTAPWAVQTFNVRRTGG